MGAIDEGIWRSGNFLVMRKDAQLPDHCVKTNQPAYGKRYKATLYWHHPAIYLLLLVNLLVYAVVAIAVRKKAIVYVGITEQALQKRRKAILWGWVVGIVGVLFLCAPLFVADENRAGIMILLSLFLMPAGMIGGIIGATIVSVERIEEELIWLRGVSKDYLAMLPQWERVPMQ